MAKIAGKVQKLRWKCSIFRISVSLLKLCCEKRKSIDNNNLSSETTCTYFDLFLVVWQAKKLESQSLNRPQNTHILQVP